MNRQTRPSISVFLSEFHVVFYSRDLEEVLEQKAQLEKQLQSKLSANAELEASLSDIRGKLELSQAYIQQLSNGGEAGGSGARPDLYAEQIEELKGQNTQLHETIAQVGLWISWS